MEKTCKQGKYDSFIWNTIGSVISASTSFVLLLCVTRSVGTVQGGIFSLAFATAQILLTVGKYGIRSFQATDVNNEISLGTYLHTRIWLCIAMLLLSLFYVMIAGYDFVKGSIFVAVCGIKMADAVEDVFHGRLQQTGHMDVAGKLLAFRNILTILCFAAGMFCLRNLLLVCVITAIISNGTAMFLNWVVTQKYERIEYKLEKVQAKLLFRQCLPLFLGSFLSLYIYNVPKYALDFLGTEEEITYYAIIFMPAFMINLCSEFVFKPLLTTLATFWTKREFEYFYKMVLKFLVIILAITFLAIIFAYFIGTQILSFLYAVNVVPYKKELVILMLSGGFSAAVYLLYNVLTSMRLQGVILGNYLVVSVIITILSFLFVKQWQIVGATIAYLLSEIILFLLMLFNTFKRKGKNKV